MVDENGVIIIGDRARRIKSLDGSLKYKDGLPHPTLIGGRNPKVLAAGELYLKGGKVTWINNKSGHFRQPYSLSVIRDAIGKLNVNVLHKNFKGYIQYRSFNGVAVPKKLR